VIKDPEAALAKVVKVLESGQKDLIAITSSQGINNIVGNDIFAKYCKKGLKCRLMAPLDLDNLEAAKKLSATYEVKHVPINFLTMMIIDDKHLFMFKSPPLNDWTSEAVFYMGDTFYTNDPRSIERVGEMLSDAWKRGMEISQITSQAGMRLPKVEASSADSVSKTVEAMLQSNVSSILITENGSPVGVVSDREILKEIVEKHLDPRKTLTRDLKYTPLVTLDTAGSITDALKIMREKGTSRVAVLKNNQLVGMLTREMAEAKDVAVATRVKES
jgi:predicted transcriptional regulator